MVVVCQVVRLQGCKVGRLQGCKYSDRQRVFLCLFCCGLLLGCKGVFVLLTLCTDPGMVEGVRGWCGVVVVLVGVVVPVVVEVGRAIPLSSSV